MSTERGKDGDRERERGRREGTFKMYMYSQLLSYISWIFISLSLSLSLSFIGDQSDPNIDEDLMREYEEFVQDFEDHLMMQEFGQT